MNIKTNLKASWLLFGSLGLSSCIKGPGFMQSGSESGSNKRVAPPIKEQYSGEKQIMATQIEGSKATGVVDSNSNQTQVMEASQNSSIAGSKVEFPPGSVAIDTQVSLSPGQSVATNSTLANLSIDTKIAASAPAVAVTSSVAIDTNVAFTVSMPMPDTSSLRLFDLAEKDPYENLVVFYNITKASTGTTVSGVMLRADILIENGYAKVQTHFFGTYQAALTTKKIEATKEIAAAPLPPIPPTQKGFEPKARRYFVAGPLTTSPEAKTNPMIKTWVSIVTPQNVGGERTLMQGLSSYKPD